MLGVVQGASCHVADADRKSAMQVAVALAAVITLMSSIAHAADGPAPRKTSQLPPATCTSNWYQGWYVGLHAAAGGYSASRTDEDGQLGSPATYTRTQAGIFGGGGQAGYNWTTCHGLFGLEVDGSAGSIVASTGVFPSNPNVDVSITSRFNGIVTARARAGIVMDTALFYVTGGAAYVHTLTTYLNLAGDQFTFSDWRPAWVAGVGAELALTSNISFRSEILYINAGDRTFSFASPILGPGNFGHGDSMWLGRIGLNVRLDFNPAIPTY